MDSTDTEIKSSAKFFGVTLESNLQWNQHIRNKANEPTAYSYSAGRPSDQPIPPPQLSGLIVRIKRMILLE